MKSLLQAVFLCLLALCCGVAAHRFHPLAPALTRTDNEIELEAAKAFPNALWIDARSAKGYEKEHVEGAVLLNEDSWNELLGGFMEAWTPDRPVVIYCSSSACNRSHKVAERMKSELGIAEGVYVLRNGWKSLVRAGLVGEEAEEGAAK